MPFITEELWLQIKDYTGAKGETIMLQSYPIANPNKIDRDAITSVNWMQALITAVRTIRAERNIEPRKLLPALLQNHTLTDRERLAQFLPLIQSVGRLESVTLLDESETAPDSASTLAGSMRVLLPLGSIIDKNQELERLNREIDKRQTELDKLNNKFSNPNFIKRAPTELIKKDRTRIEEIKRAIDQLKIQHQQIELIP